MARKNTSKRVKHSRQGHSAKGLDLTKTLNQVVKMVGSTLKKPASVSSGRKSNRPSNPRSRRPPKHGNVKIQNGQTSRSPAAKSARPNDRNMARGAQILSDAEAGQMENMLMDVNLQADFEDQEDVLVPINPHLLAEYLYGIVMSPLDVNDDPNTSNAAYTTWCTLIVLFNDMSTSLSDIALPKAIVRLRKALEPRRIGKYNYIADWTGYNIFASSFASLGLPVFGPPGSAGSYYFSTTTTTNSFYVAANVPSTVGGAGYDAMSKYFGSFASHFDLVNYDDYVDDKKDASAFAFDAAGPILAPPQKNSSVVSCAGFYDNAGSKQYISQTGSWGLETHVRRPDLASLRLGTYCAYVTAAGLGNTFVQLQRLQKFSRLCLGLPSVLGWASHRNGLRGRILLKPVPVSKTAQTLLSKVESIVKALGTTFQTTWLAAFSANQIKLLIYEWIMNQTKRFSGAYFGAALLQNGGIAAQSSCPEFHAGCSVATTCRIPEFASRLLGAMQPVTGKDSSIVPMYLQMNFTSLTSILGASYSTEVIVPPAQVSDAAYGSTLVQGISAIYKSFEATFATVVNMSPYGYHGQSFVDTTTLVNNASTQLVIGVSSRRPLIDTIYYDYLSVIGSVGYDIAEGSSLGPIGAGSRAEASKIYSQFYRRDTSGIDVIDSYVSLYLKEGIVLNGFTSNMTGSDTSGRGPAVPLAPPMLESTPLTRDVPQDAKSFVIKWAARLVPRKGNYCGPNWTAGVEPSVDMPSSIKGKYQIDPIDAEDAICKQHDEAYEASVTLADFLLADREMVSQLDRLSRSSGLSLYGHAARLAIAIKAKAANPGDSPRM